MTEIKLPKPFGNVVKTYYSDTEYTIIEVFVDSYEYTLSDGTKCLRNWLNLNGDDTCCDCYCVVQLKAGHKEGILFEDKDIKKCRNRQVNDGIRQLEFTHNKIIENNGSYPLNWAFLTNAKFQSPMKAKTLSGRRCKVLVNEMKNSPVKIRNSEIEVFIV